MMNEGIAPSSQRRFTAPAGIPPGASRPRQSAWLLGLLFVILVLPAWCGEAGRAALRYERAAVLTGDYWRLLTAHLIHGDGRHLALNLTGLGLLAMLFPRAYSAREWGLIMLASMAVIDLGFVFLEPQLHWYLGFSGILHGGLAAGALAWWRQDSRASALALTLILLSKLFWEQLGGGLPLSGDLPVVVEAHLYGAIGGGLGATLLRLRTQDWWCQSRSL
ncbi:rhombosortase [Steroidobacter denitrificans]|uniref:rhombosortase n=1 Tax=Steroidobacter denitrificans TaxID=465721 RepID=UPI00143C1542|nr:rhombosortase [Steroidobacter denitrificans]